MKELKNKRTYTTKHFDKGDGSFVIEAFNKPVHYKDENGQLQDVDLTIIDKGDYYDVAKTEFSIRVQKNFLASDFLQYKNRYKGGKHILSFEPAPLVWFNKKDWSDEVIVGQPQNIKGVVEGNKIIYKNAYGEGFDFEITILLTGFRKEIVIQNNSFLSTKPTKSCCPIWNFSSHFKGNIEPFCSSDIPISKSASGESIGQCCRQCSSTRSLLLPGQDPPFVPANLLLAGSAHQKYALHDYEP